MPYLASRSFNMDSIDPNLQSSAKRQSFFMVLYQFRLDLRYDFSSVLLKYGAYFSAPSDFAYQKVV